MQTTNNHQFSDGFSSLELLIVLLVISILATIAYPSYNQAILSSRRAQGRTALHALLMQQEQYYTQYQTYFAFDSTTPNSPFKWWSGNTVTDSFYELRAQNCPEKDLKQCVLLTAIPGTENVKNNDDPVCGNLMLDSANQTSYSNSDNPNPLCW